MTSSPDFNHALVSKTVNKIIGNTYRNLVYPPYLIKRPERLDVSRIVQVTHLYMKKSELLRDAAVLAADRFIGCYVIRWSRI